MSDLVDDESLLSRKLTPAETSSMGEIVNPYLRDDGDDILVVVPTESQHVNEAGESSGYVLAVKGNALVWEVANPFVTAQIGSGVTALAVQSPVNEEDFLRTFKTQTEYDPYEQGAQLEFNLGKKLDHFGSNPEYLVLIRGNDRAAAAKLLDTIVPGNTKVRQVAESAEYTDAVESSRSLRIAAGVQWAAVHGLEVDTVPVADVVTHSLELATGKFGDNVKDKVYLAYNDAINTSKSTSGALVYQGPMGKYQWFRGPQTKNGVGDTAHWWSNAIPGRPFSVAPANTGRVQENSSRKAAMHPDMARQEASRRLRFGGVSKKWHPVAEQAYYDLDLNWAKVQTAMGAPEGGPVTRETITIVATALPPFHVSNLSLHDLLDVADKSGEPEFPVRIDGPIVSKLQQNWPKVRARLAGESTLSALLANETNDEVTLSTEVFRALQGVVSLLPE